MAGYFLAANKARGIRSVHSVVHSQIPIPAFFCGFRGIFQYWYRHRNNSDSDIRVLPWSVSFSNNRLFDISVKLQTDTLLYEGEAQFCAVLHFFSGSAQWERSKNTRGCVSERQCSNLCPSWLFSHKSSLITTHIYGNMTVITWRGQIHRNGGGGDFTLMFKPDPHPPAVSGTHTLRLLCESCPALLLLASSQHIRTVL